MAARAMRSASGSIDSSDSSGSSSSGGGGGGGSGRRLAGGYGPYCAYGLAKFWSPLEVGYGTSPDDIAWGAIPQCIGIWVMGACMSALDNMLKLSSTENALKIDLDYNHEMQVGGAATLLSAFLGGMPAYGQTKFNLINFSIIVRRSPPLWTLAPAIPDVCLPCGCGSTRRRPRSPRSRAASSPSPRPSAASRAG